MDAKLILTVAIATVVACLLNSYIGIVAPTTTSATATS